VSGWWEHGGQTLVISGATKGVGKTHAAYAIGNHVVQETDVVAWSVIDLIDAIKPGGDERAYDEACRATLLILTDLGAERVTDWSLERLLGIIDTRWREGRRMVVDTNLTSAEILARYGDRLLSRLEDGLTAATFTGKSYRRPLAW
jgi:DNA replication protein DnaC